MQDLKAAFSSGESYDASHKSIYEKGIFITNEDDQIEVNYNLLFENNNFKNSTGTYIPSLILSHLDPFNLPLDESQKFEIDESSPNTL